MRAVYVDESGSPYTCYEAYVEGLRKGGYPFIFVLAGVGIEERHLPIVDEWFRAAKAGFFGTAGTGGGLVYEIKGSILYSLLEGKEPVEWRNPKPKRKRTMEAQKAVWGKLSISQLASLERSVFDLLRRLTPTLWIVAVKQHKLFPEYKEKTWPPYYWALTYLQQRVAWHVQATHGAYQRAMFIMDEHSSLHTAAQYDQFLQIRQTINGTAPWPIDFERYLMDAPLYGKSHLHQSLQIADVVAHAAWRNETKNDTRKWFAEIEPLLAKHWRKQPGRMDYQNAGLTHIQ